MLNVQGKKREPVEGKSISRRVEEAEKHSWNDEKVFFSALGWLLKVKKFSSFLLEKNENFIRLKFDYRFQSDSGEN